jgi:DNA polymerase III epsilon subunit-like protein
MVDFKLGTVTKQLGIEFNRADLHDAMVDIALTRQMYYTILKSEAKIEEAKTTMLNTVTVSPTGEKLEKKKYIKFLDQIIDIGKYKNNPISYIMQNDPQYIIWLSENVKFMEIDHLIIAQAKEEIEWRKATAVNKQEQSFINKYNPSYKSYQSSEEPPLNINTTDGYTDDDLPF